MKFIDINKRNSPAKMNIIALFFVLIAITGIFLSISGQKEVTKEKVETEKLRQIARDTTLKNINIQYKPADSGAFAQKENMTGVTGYTSKFFQSMLTVVVLLVAFVLMIYFFKKNNKAATGKDTNIKISEKKYIGQKQYLATVEVDDERILIGVTDQSINLLKVLKNKEKSEQALEKDEAEREEGHTFPKILGEIRKEDYEK